MAELSTGTFVAQDGSRANSQKAYRINELSVMPMWLVVLLPAIRPCVRFRWDVDLVGTETRRSMLSVPYYAKKH